MNLSIFVVRHVSKRVRTSGAFLLLIASLLSGCGGGGGGEAASVRPTVAPTSSAFQCVARNAYTGVAVYPVESAGVTPGNAYAFTGWLSDGTPYVMYGPRYFQLSVLIQEFVKMHECAHLSIPTSDEILANCSALIEFRRRGGSRAEEESIALWHLSEGFLMPQYGGTGANFWNLTLQCAGLRTGG